MSGVTAIAEFHGELTKMACILRVGVQGEPHDWAAINARARALAAEVDQLKATAEATPAWEWLKASSRRFESTLDGTKPEGV